MTLKIHNGNKKPQDTPERDAVQVDVDPSRGLLASAYAHRKRDLMALINQIRSTGASLDVE